MEEMMNLKKMETIVKESRREAADYMMTENITDCRTIFRIRTQMIGLKGELKASYKDNMECEACDNGVVEDQAHVMTCKGYEEARRDLDVRVNRDLARYYQRVMILREKMREKKD